MTGARGLRRYADTARESGIHRRHGTRRGTDPHPRSTDPFLRLPNSSRIREAGLNTSVPLSANVIATEAPRDYPALWPIGEMVDPAISEQTPHRDRPRFRPLGAEHHPRHHPGRTRCSYKSAFHSCGRRRDAPLRPNITLFRGVLPRYECAAGSGHGPSFSPPYASTSTILSEMSSTVRVEPRIVRPASNGFSTFSKVSMLTLRLCPRR